MGSLIGGYNQEAHEKPLHQYQAFAHNWGLDKLYVKGLPGCAWFLDPGLGKTRTTCTLLDTLFSLGEIKRALIVAPLRPVYTVWPFELKRWGFPQSNVILHKQQNRAMFANRQIEVINYDGVHKIKDMGKRWDIVIFDESTAYKNWNTKRMRAIRKLIKPIRWRVGLTGTPATNSLADLFAQIYVLDNGERLGRTLTEFRQHFCHNHGYMGRQWAVSDEYKEAIRAAISDITLRMKAEDFLDMPKLVTNDVWVEMSKRVGNGYQQLKRELVAELSEGTVFALSASAAYGKCRQYAGGQVYEVDEEGEKTKDGSLAKFKYIVVHKEKVDALCELHNELHGKPLLVFYHFSHELAEIKKRPQFKNAPVFNGGAKIHDIERVTNEWNEGKHTSLLCQWQAASHGLNLQKKCADLACFGLTDMPEVFQQAFRRVYRQGNESSQVRIHRILTRGTVDEIMSERLEGKFKTEADFLSRLKEHGAS